MDPCSNGFTVSYSLTFIYFRRNQLQENIVFCFCFPTVMYLCTCRLIALLHSTFRTISSKYKVYIHISQRDPSVGTPYRPVGVGDCSQGPGAGCRPLKEQWFRRSQERPQRQQHRPHADLGRGTVLHLRHQTGSLVRETPVYPTYAGRPEPTNVEISSLTDSHSV